MWANRCSIIYVFSVLEVSLPIKNTGRFANFYVVTHLLSYLEPVCCKKHQKIVPDQLLVCRVGDLWRTWLILNESKLFPWSSRISLVPFRTFRGPLFPKPVTGQELFLAVSYSKPALGTLCKSIVFRTWHWNLHKFEHIFVPNFFWFIKVQKRSMH